MKVVILCGGLGTRLDGDNPDRIPKPLTTIGGFPIVEHIMDIYAHYNHNEFILCLGYKGNFIKRYFADYYLNNSDVSIDLGDNLIRYRNKDKKKYLIHLVDTGEETATASRLMKIKNYIGGETFLMTYGDGLSDVPIDKVIEFHNSHKKLVTVTTVRPKGQFGIIETNDTGKVINFQEKPKDHNAYINAGFFVIDPKIFNQSYVPYIPEGFVDIWWESESLPKLVKDGELMAYQHEGNFKALDSPKDKKELEEMWNLGDTFWRYE